MNEFMGWIVAGISGVAGMTLGAFFFGGLWWTVKASVSSTRPGLLVFASLLVRLGITLAGFYLVAGGDWQRLVACLLGFVLARLIITRFVSPRFARHDVRRRDASPEITHAP